MAVVKVKEVIKEEVDVILLKSLEKVGIGNEI
jgi:hypothetical protein